MKKVIGLLTVAFLLTPTTVFAEETDIQVEENVEDEEKDEIFAEENLADDEKEEIIVEENVADEEKKGIILEKNVEDEKKYEIVVEENKKEIKNNNMEEGTPVLEEINGWVFSGNAWYYYSSNIPYTGWHYMSAADGEKTPHWSYFGEDGRMRTDWQRMGTTYNPDGGSSEHWSYFGKNGWLRTGWVRMGKGTADSDNNSTPHWSYFGNNGWLQTGWKHLTAADGEKTPHWSYFGENGWLRTGWQTMSTNYNPDGNSQQHWSYFGDNGWLKTGWYQEKDGISGLRYFGENGWLVGGHGYSKGWQKVGRVYYRFNDAGEITGANMPLDKTYDQMAYIFLGACGPTASFHAAHATDSLTTYPNTSNGYKKYVWDFYGMPYNTHDKAAKGVYTTGSSIAQLTYTLKKNGVDVESSANRQYTVAEVKDALTHGQAIVPLMYVWYEGKSSSYWSQHYVAVTGWRQEGNSLQFYTIDSYEHANTGWTDVNAAGKRNSGYSFYTGYNAETKAAPTPRSGVGYAMKVGSYVPLT